MTHTATVSSEHAAPLGDVSALRSLAVVLDAPRSLRLAELALTLPGPEDVVVSVVWSGISSGTERLLYTGSMPHFPGLSYPLVPGYESVGRVVWSGAEAPLDVGDAVFVPGARCYQEAAGLFGGSGRTVVVPASRTVPLPGGPDPRATLLALTATALHALDATELDDGADTLVVGHGVLGRLLARLVTLLAPDHQPPTVWEAAPVRRQGSFPYSVVAPGDDPRASYRTIVDVSGDPAILDSLIARLAPGGEIVLAGFYDRPLSFEFAPAFMREARMRVAAQWQPGDLHRAAALMSSGRVSLDDLISHRVSASDAETAYRTAFEDAGCLKMVLDWRQL